MRAVNLIPPDERRGDRAPLRTGVFTYVLVGGLALLLLGIVAVALTSKQINDRQSQKQSLDQELQQATAKAQSLQAFTNFRAVQETRAATVSSLAQSRFDWQRVLHELSLILPNDVWLNSVTGTVSPAVQMESSGGGGGEGSGLRAQIAGPALDISGCATGQDAVAAFVSSLEDVDGVTRVGLDSSKTDEEEGGSGATSSGSTGSSATGSGCGPNVFSFQLVVAFDAVPAPPTATSVPSVPAPAAPSGSSGSDQAQVSDLQNQQKVQAASAREKTTQAKNEASNLIPGS
jgi:Tfp pilus assembly protein PilN